MDSKLWYLKQCDLFVGLGPEQAGRLEQNASVRTFRRGCLIYFPTQPGQSVMVLLAGRVKIKGLTPEGKETILAFIEPGELFGELALFDDDAREDYAEAVIDSRVLLLHREDLRWLMGQHPDFALSVTKLVGLRRRRVENRLRNVLFLSSRQRLVRVLLELGQAHGERDGDRCEVRLPLSHQDLASLIGVTRETVTLLLGEMHRERLVEVARQRLTVLAWGRLADEAQGGRPPRAPVTTRGAGGPRRPSSGAPRS